MGEDEQVIFVLCCIIAGIFWINYLYRTLSIHRFYNAKGSAFILLCAPLLSVLIIGTVLKTLASFDVQESAIYIAFYVMMGFAWVGGNTFLFRSAGYHWHYDCLECKNHAAAIVVCAGMVSVAICYSGANIGDGPGWWCVAYAGFLATFALHVTWWLVETFHSISDAVTIDRNIDISIRFSGFLIGSSLIYGRAAAGDWTDASQTLKEFLVAWPVVILYVIFYLGEKSLTYNPNNLESKKSNPPLSFVIAVAYVLLAIFIIYWLPPIPNNPIYDQK